MSIAVVCPECDHRFSARDELAGKRVRCPQCSGPVPVTAPRAALRPSAPPGLRAPAAPQSYEEEPEIVEPEEDWSEEPEAEATSEPVGVRSRGAAASHRPAASRGGGNGSMPAWGWLVIGVSVAAAVIGPLATYALSPKPPEVAKGPDEATLKKAAEDAAAKLDALRKDEATKRDEVAKKADGVVTRVAALEKQIGDVKNDVENASKEMKTLGEKLEGEVKTTIESAIAKAIADAKGAAATNDPPMSEEKPKTAKTKKKPKPPEEETDPGADAGGNHETTIENLKELQEKCEAFKWTPKSEEEYKSLAEIAKAITEANKTVARGEGDTTDLSHAVKDLMQKISEVKWSKESVAKVNEFAGVPHERGGGIVAFAETKGIVTDGRSGRKFVAMTLVGVDRHLAIPVDDASKFAASSTWFVMGVMNRPRLPVPKNFPDADPKVDAIEVLPGVLGNAKL